MQSRQFYRSRSNTMIGGVAGGLAEYFNLDPLVVRILFVVLAMVGGGGVLLYLALWIFIPLSPYTGFESFNSEKMENETNFNAQNDQGYKEPWRDPVRNRNNGNLIGGLILITLGVLFLLDRFLPRIDFGDLWPVLLVVAGIAVLAGSFNNSKKN